MPRAAAVKERGATLRLIEEKMAPKESCTVSEIAARTGLDNTAVANAINPRVAKKNGWTRVKRGTYKFLGYGAASGRGATKVKVAGTRAKKASKRTVAKRTVAPRAATTVANGSTVNGMKMIGHALDGTPLMRDSEGALYKVTPLA